MKDLDKRVAATVTSNGRITIPKPLRDALGWEPGYKLDMLMEPPGEIVLSEVTSSASRQKALTEAIDRILERRKQLHLDGLTIRCLIDEEREE